jgi:hypothetical protein
LRAGARAADGAALSLALPEGTCHAPEKEATSAWDAIERAAGPRRPRRIKNQDA